MPKEKRRPHSPEQKLAILREHLVEWKPVSDICEYHKIAPSLFYYGQKQLFENEAVAFTQPAKSLSREHELATRVEQLEAKIARKNTVIAESGWRRRRVQRGARLTVWATPT
jgi:transposase-like protein